MGIHVSQTALDDITVEGNTFPIDAVLGAFYQNGLGEFVCAGSVIWDDQSNVIPVWGSANGIQDGQEFILFAFVNGETFYAISPVLDSDAVYFSGTDISLYEADFSYFSNSDNILYYQSL